MKIGRFDLAKGYGQALLQNKPNPVELFQLVQANQAGYDLAMKVAELARDEELAKLTGQLLSRHRPGTVLATHRTEDHRG